MCPTYWKIQNYGDWLKLQDICDRQNCKFSNTDNDVY